MFMTAKYWPSCARLTNGIIARHTFDHRHSQYFRTACKLNRQQARWALELAEYDFGLLHMQEKRHGKPDALSCRPEYDKGENDNNERTLLTAKHFRELAVEVDSAGDEITVEDPVFKED